MSVFVGNYPVSSKNLAFAIDALQPSRTLTEVEVLLVGGGGGGGYQMGGGGGGGGVVYKTTFSVTPGTGISAVIGLGGAGRTSNSDNGGQGGNTTFGNLTAVGGGAGGNNSSAYNGTASDGRPLAGGSGGGAGEGQSTAPGVYGQGNRGGGAIELGYYHSGGGGGAGGVGRFGHTEGGGNGGPGLAFTIEGVEKYYAGGGGGGIYSPAPGKRYPGEGGVGGGGAGGWFNVGEDGVANTGGGGGGGSYDGNSYNGGAGGSGIVVVRYPGAQKATGGNTIRYVDGHTIHIFTSDGTFTPLTNPETLSVDDLSGNNNPFITVNSAELTTVDGIRCWNTSASSKELRHVENRLQFGSQHTLVAVARALSDADVNNWRTLWRSSPDDHALLIQDGTDIVGFYDNNGGGFNSYGFTTAGTGIANTWAVYTIVASGGSTTLYINDGSTYFGTVPYTIAGNYHYQLGSHFDQNFGYVAAAYVYNNRAFTVQEVAANYQVLKRRYNL